MDWISAIFLYLALIGLGVGVMSLPPEPLYLVGRGFFIAAALVLIAKSVWWSVVAESPNGLFRILIAGAVWAVSGAILAGCLQWISAHDLSGKSIPPVTQIAAHPFSDPQTQEEKAYVLYWANLVQPNLLYGWFGDAGSVPPKETSITIYLTNVGPGDIRNLKLLWTLQCNELIHDLVQRSGLFEGRITEWGNDYLRFKIIRGQGTNEGGFLFSKSAQNEIPVIVDGATQRAVLPERVKNALFLISLAESRLMEQRAIDFNRRTRRIADFEMLQMCPISVGVHYENANGQAVGQTFVIGGTLSRSNVPPGGGLAINAPDAGAKLGHIVVVKQ